MSVGDNYRRIDPSDQLVFDVDGALVGLRSGKSDAAELRLGAPLTAGEVATLRQIAGAYDVQPATWYAGEISSVVTPSITADGDLATATDQVPLKWLAVVNPDDDVTAAQALLNGGPNVIEVLPGAMAQQAIYGTDGVTPQVITRVYAVCISSSAVPSDYTGGAYILSDADTDLADALANMARFEFSSGLGATVVRLVADRKSVV
jgi:hypothetical protein